MRGAAGRLAFWTCAPLALLACSGQISIGGVEPTDAGPAGRGNSGSGTNGASGGTPDGSLIGGAEPTDAGTAGRGNVDSGTNGASGGTPGGSSVNTLQCASGAPPDAGPTTLAVGQNATGYIAIDATSVYWTGLFNEVRKVSLCGGTPTVLAAVVDKNGLAASGYGAIAVNATGVYWTDITSVGASVAGVLMRSPVDQAMPTSLASEPAGGGPVAVDQNNVYWASGGNVMKMALVGGTPIVLNSLSGSSVSGIAVDATSLYWTAYPPPATRSGAGGTVTKVALIGGTPIVLATSGNSGQGIPGRILVDSTSVYWTNDGSSVRMPSSVMKVGLAGGTPTTLVLPDDESSIDDIAVDDKNLYWVKGGDTLMKMPLGGGAQTVLASGQQIASIAVDATNVYWTGASSVPAQSSGPGTVTVGGVAVAAVTVMKLAKP